MHGKLNSITTKLQDLEKEKVTFHIVVKDGKPKNVKRKYETSLPEFESGIVGRQYDKKELLGMLLKGEPCNQNFSLVPIVGMGGVGKTALARSLYNGAQVKEHFELKMWVCVSDKFDIFNISNIIYQSLTGQNNEFADLNLLQLALKDKLSEKRFLLVLDDVWNDSYDDWVTLVRPFHIAAPNSKIIMTTRKHQLLKQLGYNHPYHLQILSHDDALCLFSQHAFGVNNFDSYPTLRALGDGIVEKCNGLPLALVALGRLMRIQVAQKKVKKAFENADSSSRVKLIPSKIKYANKIVLNFHKEFSAFSSLLRKENNGLLQRSSVQE
nr:putative disease resistance protein At3g14460 [Tanacetum cinerariifolium]